MKPSIQKYVYPKSATFNGALWVKSWDGVLLVGGIGNAGLLVCLDKSNQVKWTRELLPGAAPTSNNCWFTHAKETPDGDVLVYGHLRIGNYSGRHIVLKVDSAGTKKFCKLIYSDKSRRSISFLPLSNDQFLISGWCNKAYDTGDDSIETISVSAQGDPTYRVMWVKGSSDDQLLGSCITEDTSDPSSPTCVFQVGTSNINGIKGFLAKGAGGIKPFNIVGGKHFSVNGATATQLEAVISPDTHRFVVAGTYNIPGQPTNRAILVSGEYRGLTLANHYFQKDNAQGFKFLTGNERIRNIYLINGFLYVLGFDTVNLTSFIAKFDQQLNLIWPSAKSFNFIEKAHITDIADAGNNTLYLTGFLRQGPNNFDSPLLICTDYELNTCKTVGLPITQDGTKDININNWPCEPKDMDPTSTPMGDFSTPTPVVAEELCPIPGLTLGNNALIQSPYLYLQAAGSDGLESTAGIHLRWFLLRNLGNTHLPKGNYAATTNNFNKPDDFVRVYRAPYTPGGIGFKINSLNAFTVNHQAGLWVYKHSNLPVTLYLWWRNLNQYTQVVNQIGDPDSQANIDAYFQAYFQSSNNYIEFEIKGDLAFAYQAVVTPSIPNTNNVEFKTESFSVEGDFPGAEKKISARKGYSGTYTNPVRIVGENLKFIRYSVKSGRLAALTIETYGAFLQNALSNNTIEKIGDFALTKNTAEAHLRLEDTSRQVNVHGNWKKFNDNANVNVANYKKRWEDNSNLGTGMAKGVSEYIALSDNASNPTAKKILPANTPYTPDLEVSFLDMLLLASTDFHAARMLGLGHIDTPLGISPIGLIADTFIYIAEYHTSGLLDNASNPQNVQHLFLSLPTAKKDHRLPEKLTIPSLTYGLTVQANTPTPILITDSNGYTPDGKSRFINLWAALENDHSLSNGFFDPAVQFEAARYTSAIMAGVEYRKKNSTAWQKPELAHEANYADTQGVLETIPIVFKENSATPLFIHQEKDPGFHEYAVYAVNIFSRASDLSTPKATNETLFTKTNSLLPPTDLRVQLIQDEGPLLLTTQEEQDYFTQLTGDKTLVRLTFNYHHVHDGNYDFADKVEVFCRKEIPRNVRGGVASIVNNTDKRFATITTTDYKYASNGKDEIPQIPTGLINNFIGGVMVLNGHRYKIENIQLPGGNANTPTFTVWKEEDRSMQSGAGQSAMTQTFLPIQGAQGDLFMVIENMAKADNWGTSNPLATMVQIGNSQWQTETETFENSNGDTITRSLRGFWDDADISVDHLEDQKDQNGNIVKTTAVYKITLKTLKINHHAQYVQFNPANPKNSVNWFKGVIRIPLKGEPQVEKKVLPVIGIENVGNGQNTIVYAHCDEKYDPNRFESQDRVNFYPGYRLYIHSEAAKGFTGANLLPGFGEDSRQTLMGVRSWDSSNNYRSPMGVPAILLAQKIIAPLQPEKPIGPAFATPPDKYFKSAYTFSVQLASRNSGQEPYAVVFYRADLKAILSALYKQETIELIAKALPDPLEDADYFTARWQNLIGFDFTYDDPNKPFYDPTTGPNASVKGTFRRFPAGTGFQFPNPDRESDKNNPDLISFDGTQVPGNIDPDLLKEAIYSVFLPLAKEPILYADIVSNTDIKPSKPAKMNGTKVQFTDFTLDGAMKTSYFYCAREMGNTMQLGDMSAIMGPIQLINTDPPQAPIVQKVITQIADSLNGVDTAVRFELLPFSSHDNIKKIYIYRTNNSTDALSVRTMGEPTKKIDFDPKQSTNPVIFVDDFANDPEIPFGDPLYFRLVALREVKYKDFALQDVVDYVPSQPTKILLSNVVDLKNPEAPEITATVASSTSNELNGVKLNWSKTTYFGVYRLFKMNNSGNWNKIFEVKSNDPKDLEYSFSDPLPKLDEDQNPIYHHFKISVESTSGLLNLKDKMFTLGGA